MVGKTARKFYLGQGVPRLGCAQAVAEALRESYGLDDKFVQSMALLTGGRAPLGYCGAIHSAITIAEQKVPNKKKEIEDFFKSKAGGVKCREIRAQKQFMCADCVEHAASLLSYEPSGKG